MRMLDVLSHLERIETEMASLYEWLSDTFDGDNCTTLPVAVEIQRNTRIGTDVARPRRIRERVDEDLIVTAQKPDRRCLWLAVRPDRCQPCDGVRIEPVTRLRFVFEDQVPPPCLWVWSNYTTIRATVAATIQ